MTYPIQTAPTAPAAAPAGGLSVHHQPRQIARGIIIRALDGDDGEIEILVFEQDIADLEARLDRIRAAFVVYARQSGRGVQLWPVGHPDRATGFVIAGLGFVEVAASLAALPGITWSGNAAASILSGRW